MPQLKLTEDQQYQNLLNDLEADEEFEAAEGAGRRAEQTEDHTDEDEEIFARLNELEVAASEKKNKEN